MAVEVSWFAAVVGELRRHREDGHSFDIAWSLATRSHPARAKDDGGYVPRLFGTGGEETVVGFFRRACEEAWNGERPKLAHFQVEAIREVESTAPARRALGGSRFRQAA